MVQYVAYIHDLCMTLIFDLNIKICIFTMNLSLARSSLLFDIGIPRSGIWVYYHETTCCVHSWPLNDLDIWPIRGWRGVSLVSLTHSFLSCFVCFRLLCKPCSNIHVLWFQLQVVQAPSYNLWQSWFALVISSLIFLGVYIFKLRVSEDILMLYI